MNKFIKHRMKREAEKSHIKKYIVPFDDRYGTLYKARKALIRARVLRSEMRQKVASRKRKASLAK